jgi:hypothetical protein
VRGAWCVVRGGAWSVVSIASRSDQAASAHSRLKQVRFCWSSVTADAHSRAVRSRTRALAQSLTSL